MDKGLKYCMHCLEAIQIDDASCIHCGQKQKKSSLGGKLSTMMLLGLIMPACQKPADPSDVDKTPVENPALEGSTEESDGETKEETKEELEPFIPKGDIQALYGVAPADIKKITYDVTVSLDVEGEKTEEQKALEQQLQNNKAALEACYSQGWRPGISYPSELNISIVQKGGAVGEVNLGEEQDSRLGECLQNEILSWKLPVDSSSVIKITLKI